jgi:hypothetical protein
MARLEMTLAGGEKILVDHAASDMGEILRDLARDDFMLFSEVKGGSSSPAREIIVATRQVTLVRPLHDRSAQTTDLRSKQ